MDNKEYLKKFKRCINEYTNMANFVEEEGEEDNTPMADDMGGNEAPMGGEAPMGEMPAADPSMEGETPAAPEGLAPQGEEMPAADPSMGNEAPMGEMPAADPNTMNPGDEVIDVDELVDAQKENGEKIEQTDNRIEHLASKFEQVISMLGKFENNIESNNAHIEELRAELEKRNPTPVEKMTLRSKDGYPFNKMPEEYWENDAPDNYSTEDDNNGEKEPQYQITKADIDNMNDLDSITKQISNGGYHMGLGDIMNI